MGLRAVSRVAALADLIAGREHVAIPDSYRPATKVSHDYERSPGREDYHDMVTGDRCDSCLDALSLTECVRHESDLGTSGRVVKFAVMSDHYVQVRASVWVRRSRGTLPAARRKGMSATCAEPIGHVGRRR
jgi:hypothetical protein